MTNYAAHRARGDFPRRTAGAWPSRPNRLLIVIAVVALIAEWLTTIEDRLLTWRPEATVNT
jgi:hypothetical protein